MLRKHMLFYMKLCGQRKLYKNNSIYLLTKPIILLMMKMVIRILLGPKGSPQTTPLFAAIRQLRALGLIKEKDEIESKSLKEIRSLQWTSRQFISWGQGIDLPHGTKIIFIMACHPLQLDDPPAWDHLKHLADMRLQFQGD